jgi:hypothetical protein
MAVQVPRPINCSMSALILQQLCSILSVPPFGSLRLVEPEFIAFIVDERIELRRVDGQSYRDVSLLQDSESR